MSQTNDKPVRRVSLVVSVRADSLTPEQAQAIEDKIRDIMDDYPSTDVQSSRGAERIPRTAA